MSDEPITWDNIPGLTDKEREYAKRGFSIDDLRRHVIRGSVIDGVRLPDIVNGVVER